MSLFQNLVLIQLGGNPVAEDPPMLVVPQVLPQISTVPRPVEPKPFDLELTIRFGIEKIQMPRGWVELGVKRGELRLLLENGTIAREKIQLTAPFKYIQGTETEPIWGFEATTEPILHQQLTAVKLGTVEITDIPCCIQARFVVSSQTDLFLREVEGLWANEINHNKRILVEREFFLQFFVGSNSCLSQVEMRYE